MTYGRQTALIIATVSCGLRFGGRLHFRSSSHQFSTVAVATVKYVGKANSAVIGKSPAAAVGGVLRT